MKKYVFISLLALVVAVVAGCNNDSPKCYYDTETLDVRVYPDEWEFDGETLQFFYHCRVPEITYDIYNYGNWTISREFFKGSHDAYQVALPMSIYGHDTIASDKVIYYTRHIDYRVGYGYIDFQVTDSDYPYPLDPTTGEYDPRGFFPTDTMDFRIQLIY